jgi:TonB-linked SusC/RagA family outer membrane protein
MRFKALRKFLCPSPEFLTKTVRVAKLIGFMMLAACLQLSAKGYSQTVTLTKTHVSLVFVFQEIQKQTGYNFLYTYEDVDKAGMIDVNLSNTPIQEALETCLRDKPLTFSIVEKTVVIKQRTVTPKIVVPLAQPADAPPPPVIVRGHVADSLGNPLVGATVMIKGTHDGTKTNVKGDFELKDPPKGAVLVISYTGYVRTEIIANPDVIHYVFLPKSQDILDAPVIQAYGTTSRRFNVGSIVTVDAEAIARQPVTNVLLALQGQAAGLAVNATSGVPGSKVQLQLRGQRTILSSTEGFKPYDQPLFIIDGVPFAPQNNNTTQLASLAIQSSFNGGISQFGGLSAFNGINPADIESVSILKDADATSIYGTQGSNGVILITTKKGKAGKTLFNVTANTGFNSSARKLKLLNTQQYLDLRRAAYAADGATPSSDPYDQNYAPDLTIFDQNKYTDWNKLIVGKTSNNTDIHASASGGSVNDVFIISMGYTRSNFNYPGDFSDQRLTLHANMHHTSTDNRLTLDLGTDYGYGRNNSAMFGTNAMILSPPNTPDLVDAAGNFVWNYKGADLFNYQLYAGLKKTVRSQSHNLNNTLHIAYKILPGLTFSTNLGYNRNQTIEHDKNPGIAQSPAYRSISATFANNLFQTVNVEPQIDYSGSIGKGLLTVLIGGTYKKNLNNSNTINGYGYANDNFLESINGAATKYVYDNSALYKYAAGFARIRYVYDQKYILSLTGRRDGSSNFGPGNQFGNFGSAGAGWIFSEEKLFKSALPFVSFAKISGNYGTSGSDGIAPYMYQSFWAPLNGISAFQGVQSTFPQNLYNPDYSWALKKSLNLALDLGFFHDRLLFNATFYRDREGNQLGGYPLAAQAGFASVLQNLNSTIQNKGWEFSLTSNNIKTKDFTWTSNFNISANRNKLLAFPNLESSSYKSQYIIGKPTSMINGYRYKGLNPTTGLFEYYTRDGQTTIDPTYGIASQGGDQVPIADREVKYMGGIGNTFTYKGFSLFVFFQFSSQTAPNWLYSLYSSYFIGITANNQPVQALNYWKHPGDHTELQTLTSSYGSQAYTAVSHFTSSSGAYSNDTYMRLKTLSLSYAVPDNLLKKVHIRDLRIYANAQNLLTFTNYKVADPEQFNDYTAFPLQRIVACGLSFNF